MLNNKPSSIVNTSLPTESSTKSLKLDKSVDKTETVIISRPANHNEISIMEVTWNQIKSKINKIKIKTPFDQYSVLIGALIPYILDFGVDMYNGKELDFVPAFIYLIFFAIYATASRFFNYSANKTAETNKVHLDDIIELMNSADSSKNKDTEQFPYPIV